MTSGPAVLPDHTAVRDRPVAGAARPGRSAAARHRGRGRAAAGGSPATTGAPARTWTSGAPGRCGRPSRRAPGSSRTWWWSGPRGGGPVRRPRRRAGHVRPAPAGGRRGAAGVRGGPARSAGVEAAAARRPPGTGSPTGCGWSRWTSRGDWWGRLLAAGFDPGRPAVVACTGVTIVPPPGTPSRRASADRDAGSGVRARHHVPAAGRGRRARAAALPAGVGQGARASGTPFLSYFTPPRMLALVRESGFRDARHIPAEELTRRYFATRTDGLRPSRAEELVVATT